METLLLTLSQVKNGEPYAFEMIFERYWDKLFKTAAARVNNVDDAKDIVQELLISQPLKII